MDVAASLAISSSALHAQRLRMDVIAANLANAQSTRTPEGGPYKRHDVVLEAMPGGRFEDVLGAEGGGAVRVARIVEDEKPPRVVFDPGHPDADARRLRRVSQRQPDHRDGRPDVGDARLRGQRRGRQRHQARARGRALDRRP